jgi:hypothetical protein
MKYHLHGHQLSLSLSLSLSRSLGRSYEWEECEAAKPKPPAFNDAIVVLLKVAKKFPEVAKKTKLTWTPSRSTTLKLMENARITNLA